MQKLRYCCLPNKIGVAAKARLMLRQAHGILLGGTKETLILGHGVRSTGQVTWRYEALHTITSTASRHGWLAPLDTPLDGTKNADSCLPTKAQRHAYHP